MDKIESLEHLIEKVAQHFSEMAGERNNLRGELAAKNEEIERAKRECASEIEELKGKCLAYEEEKSNLASRIESLHNRLDALLESKVSEVLTGV